MEYINENAKKPTDVTNVDAEEISFCNCEKNASETTYHEERCDDRSEEICKSPLTKDRIAKGCQKLGQICSMTARRWKTNWMQSDGGFKLKQTATYRLDVCKNGEDDPADHFYAEKTNTCTLRTLLTVAAIAATMMWCFGGKKKG